MSIELELKIAAIRAGLPGVSSGPWRTFTQKGDYRGPMSSAMIATQEGNAILAMDKGNMREKFQFPREMAKK